MAGVRRVHGARRRRRPALDDVPPRGHVRADARADRGGNARGRAQRPALRAPQGVIRADLDVNDLSFLLEQIASVRLRDPNRTRELRRRYLALTLAAMRTSDIDPLPGPPPSWQDNAGRWEPAS